MLHSNKFLASVLAKAKSCLTKLFLITSVFKKNTYKKALNFGLKKSYNKFLELIVIKYWQDLHIC